MDVELRRVGAEDWELYRDVRLRALADAPTAFGSTLADARALPEETWRERAGGPGATYVVLDGERGVAMGGALGADGGPAAFVWGMWTDPAARGHGHAARILDALVAWCREQRFTEVTLHVTEGNAGARRLYVAAGFEPTGTWEPLRPGSPVRIEELRLVLGA